MDYMRLIANGKSVREYKKKNVDSKLLQKLRDYAHYSQRLMPDMHIETAILDNAVVFPNLEGIAGYQGHMIDAPHYLIICSEKKAYCVENVGYMGQDMILKANDLGLDCCWITFDNSEKIKEALNIQNHLEVLAIIALGYGNTQNKKVINAAKIGDNYSKTTMDIVRSAPSYRVNIEEMVFMEVWGKNATVAQLEERGLLEAFQYANMAPSTLNRQPWRYIIDGGTVIFILRKDANVNEYEEKIDAGISMLFFKSVMDATLFQLTWQFEKPQKDYKIPADYKVVATCNI